MMDFAVTYAKVIIHMFPVQLPAKRTGGGKIGMNDDRHEHGSAAIHQQGKGAASAPPIRGEISAHREAAVISIACDPTYLDGN